MTKVKTKQADGNVPRQRKPELVVSLLRALKQAFPNDVWAPGIVLSCLKSGQFYAGIHRYPRGEGSKLVTHKAIAESWESALKQVASEFLNGPEALETLKRAL